MANRWICGLAVCGAEGCIGLKTLRACFDGPSFAGGGVRATVWRMVIAVLVVGWTLCGVVLGVLRLIVTGNSGATAI